jgi:GAF domain-containing protein/DNA-binding CsgD family transcriptional regulator
MYTRTNTTNSPLKLFQQLGRSIRRSIEPQQMLQGAVDAIGWHFGLDRAIALLFNEQEHQLEIKAEYYKEPLKPVGPRHYQMFTSSEWYRLLLEGKPLPLIEIQSANSATATNRKPDLALLITDTGSTSVVAFPLLHQGTLIGCITLHFVQEDRNFSEDLLEMGEAFAEELSSSLRQANSLQEQLVDSRIFAGSSLPMVILERESFKISQTNTAAAQLLDGDENDLRGLPFLELFGESDAQRLKAAAGRLSPAYPVVNVHGLLAPSSGGQTVTLDGALSTISSDESSEMILALYPAASTNGAGGAPAAAAPEAAPGARVEELVTSLSRQLNWERLSRQIISKLHSTLDRDSVLQTAADAVGRALRASACLIVRTDSPVASIVTHEYADANLSPLGLGRSSQLPQGAIAYLRQRTIAIPDLSSPNRPPGLSKEDVNAMLDNGVGALLSTPIAHHGTVHGAIVVESNDARDWTPQEMEMMETIAQQAAIALSNAQSYAQLKDQLFNMNLISNLTQQLTNALDLAGRNARNERPPEVVPSETPVTPLSSRELEVLKLIASGLANREIAQKLFLTESTVELHASRIRKKLKLKSRTALVKFACDNHLV